MISKSLPQISLTILSLSMGPTIEEEGKTRKVMRLSQKNLL